MKDIGKIPLWMEPFKTGTSYLQKC